MRSNRLVAVVELLSGLTILLFSVTVGVQGLSGPQVGRSRFDQVVPFIVGALLGLPLVLMSVRHMRASRLPPPRHPSPLPPPSGSSGDTPTPVSLRRAAQVPLSSDASGAVERLVEVLARFGVLGPRAPDPDELTDAVADYGEPVTADVVLNAILEAGWYRPTFDASLYVGNVVLHYSHAEQDLSNLEGQASDLIRLSGAADGTVTVSVELGHSEDTRSVPTRLTIETTGGDLQIYHYLGASKYLSTFLHVHLARTLNRIAAPKRLAGFWSDQGVWLSGLSPDSLDLLNDALGSEPYQSWAWVDSYEPVAAGRLQDEL